MRDLTPRQIVTDLDRDIVGQGDAKRAVAIALRNRWRRQQLSEELRAQVTPKNILLIGPTGVGKTEIARRLALLVGAPFLKVEATKYTEVGYYGRDVESMVRDLVEAAIVLVKAQERERVKDQAHEHTEDRILDHLLPEMKKNKRTSKKESGADTLAETLGFASFFTMTEENSKKPAPVEDDKATPDDSAADSETDSETEREPRRKRTREKLRKQLRAGELDDREIEITLPGKSAAPLSILGAANMEQMEMELQGMLEKFAPRPSQVRRLTVGEARPILIAQETDALLDEEKIRQKAIVLAEESGIVFIDEIDKIAGEDQSGKGPDVSRQGVQRDLLPIVEGTTVTTKYGPVRTDFVLFIAAGAFHRSKPSDLMPEMQGRFPIRVELHDLTRDDFARILREPRASLIRQYQALLAAETVELEFLPDAIDVMAEIAFQVNRSTQNIGARRLHTILERIVEEISFDAPDRQNTKFVIDAQYVRDKLDPLAKDEDLSRFIL